MFKHPAFTHLLPFSLSLALCCCSVSAETPKAPPQNYEECVASGFPTTKSMPPSCTDARGITFLGQASEPASGASCKNVCGDGECQEITCMALGCPCPESAQNCPQDCKN